MSFMWFSKTVLKNLGSIPATRMYPAKKRAFFSRTRGHIQIDIHACIFCGLCQRKCPTGALLVARAQRTWSIDRLKCVQCNACVEVCPKKCLLMRNEYTQPSRKRAVEVFSDA
jgi:ech hydrogenase subunit F